MNYMDAVEILSVITTDAAQRLTLTEKDDAIAEAIQALEVMPEYERLKERGRAMKPYRTDTLPHWLCCPNCRLKQTIEGMGFSKDVIEASQFCSRCGQRIDWSMEEEHES